MEQKIIIKMQMNSDKCRSKAMQVAAVADGVSYVKIEREADQLVVIGDGVDSVCLINSLRKKFGNVTLVSVEPVKPEVVEEKPNDDPVPIQWQTWPYHPQFYTCQQVCDPNPPSCSIM
ncbi:unnamed protein product [Ilex paraguariensis]|uniref:HMA domain-containing protein n=1 Tax=Ilex paraguariensis TaxID=185542 RepID=A0ABC8RJZ1_9AQUA